MDALLKRLLEMNSASVKSMEPEKEPETIEDLIGGAVFSAKVPAKFKKPGKIGKGDTQIINNAMLSFECYKNVLLMMSPKYCNLKIVPKAKFSQKLLKYLSQEKLTRDKWISLMYQRQQICTMVEKDGKMELMYFTPVSSGIRILTSQVRPILNRICKEYPNLNRIHFFSEQEINEHIKKALNETKSDYINYMYCYFDMPVHDWPFLGEVKVLSDDEAEKIARDMRLNKKNDLPIIFHNDPLALWYGARIGQIISVSSFFSCSGLDIEYRIVVHNDSKKRKGSDIKYA